MIDLFLITLEKETLTDVSVDVANFLINDDVYFSMTKESKRGFLRWQLSYWNDETTTTF